MQPKYQEDILQTTVIIPVATLHCTNNNMANVDKIAKHALYKSDQI